MYSTNILVKISTKHKAETEDFLCHAFSTNLVNFSFCIFPLSFPNVENSFYLPMGNTWINIGEGVTEVTWQVFQQMWQML